MVNEVNKIIHNTILDQGGVSLPGIGTIYVTRKPATKISSKSISAPRLTLALSPDKRSISIVDAIANIAQIEITQAEDIYRRWLNKVRQDDGSISIFEVCSINNSHIVIDPLFSSKLNPSSNNEIEISCRSHTYRNISIILAVIAVAFAAAYWLYSNTLKETTSNEVQVEISTEAITDNNIDEIEIILDDNQDVTTDDITEEIADDEIVVEEQGSTTDMIESVTIDDWRQRDDIRHWVVVGSYSSEENVARAITDLEAKNPDIMFATFQLGSMYAVAAFGSSEYADCESFKQEHMKQFKQSWIHTPRKYKK
ncbi:MAG: hypothetical protein J6V59_01465 [Alistipes sp.]|nr:hypothetical protein [Alistipes sp.]